MHNQKRLSLPKTLKVSRKKIAHVKVVYKQFVCLTNCNSRLTRLVMSHEEDDDAFLYGDDEATELITKRQKLDSTEPNDESGRSTTEAGVEEKDNENDEQKGNDNDEEEDEEEEEGDEEDSDSDIEFIIGTEEPKKTEEKPVEASTVETTTATAAVPEALDEVNDLEQTKVTPQTTEATITRIPDIDINKVGELDGKPITSINLQDLKEKPWRQPGADVSEYFNYGFDEFTWTAYCAKQDKLRSEFNPQKIWMSMMSMGMPPPPMMMGLPNAGLPGVPISLPGAPQLPQPTQGPLDQAQLPQLPQPPQVPVPSSSDSSGFQQNLPKAPAGREREARDRNEFDRERGNNGYNRENFRERDRRPRFGNRGRR